MGGHDSLNITGIFFGHCKQHLLRLCHPYSYLRLVYSASTPTSGIHPHLHIIALSSFLVALYMSCSLSPSRSVVSPSSCPWKSQPHSIPTRYNTATLYRILPDEMYIGSGYSPCLVLCILQRHALLVWSHDCIRHPSPVTGNIKGS
jgi:hypothetical protein